MSYKVNINGEMTQSDLHMTSFTYFPSMTDVYSVKLQALSFNISDVVAENDFDILYNMTSTQDINV